MRLPFLRILPLAVCSSLLLFNPLPTTSQAKSEPQLVRILYAQGELSLPKARRASRISATSG
jgi:hypothetical protein